MAALFTWDFNPKNSTTSIKDIIDNIEVIDQKILSAATERPITQINKIDLAILRLSIFELIIVKETPPKVVIDEAVELGKEYGSDSSPGFINGALGNLVEQEKIST